MVTQSSVYNIIVEGRKYTNRWYNTKVKISIFCCLIVIYLIKMFEILPEKNDIEKRGGKLDG